MADSGYRHCRKLRLASNRLLLKAVIQQVSFAALRPAGVGQIRTFGYTWAKGRQRPIQTCRKLEESHYDAVA